MADFQYTTVPGKIKPLLSKIREAGIPSNATSPWLKTLGFKSSNDRSLLNILKYIGFLDGSVPTKNWKDYRGKYHGQVLANAIREGYSELYSVYSDAHTRSPDDLEHVFGTASTAGKQVIDKTVRTFRSLCEAADFSESGIPTPSSAPAADQDLVQQPPPIPNRDQSQLSLHIDIQVHISPDSSTAQIDQIFESMAKHLNKSGSTK
jgi:hypothetical protein